MSVSHQGDFFVTLNWQKVFNGRGNVKTQTYMQYRVTGEFHDMKEGEDRQLVSPYLTHECTLFTPLI